MKKTNESTNKSREAVAIGPEAVGPEARAVAVEPEAQVVNLSAETVEAIADAIAERFERVVMPLIILHSRLCAADTVRTSERPDTVFRHAIKEAEIARTEIEKYFQATNV